MDPDIKWWQLRKNSYHPAIKWGGSSAFSSHMWGDSSAVDEKKKYIFYFRGKQIFSHDVMTCDPLTILCSWSVVAYDFTCMMLVLHVLTLVDLENSKFKFLSKCKPL